jgi:hypothetical protein
MGSLRSHRLSGLVLALAMGIVVGASAFRAGTNARTQEKKDQKVPDLPTLAAEMEKLKTHEVDQAHAMMDVGYHFANLWHAGQKKNWDLAEFYLSESRSHLRWAVRLKPIRKDAVGLEIDLQAILQALENTPLADLEKAIKNKDLKEFEKAYRFTLEGCYSCHKASAKPFLRLQVPRQPPEAMVIFEPEGDGVK